MKQADINQVLDAIDRYTTPLTAEVRAMRAEVAAYRAEVSAERAETAAHVARMEGKFTDLDRDIQALTDRLFGDDQ